MIQSLSIRNFLSFKDEVLISFDATKDTHLEEYHTIEVAKGVKLLKLAIIYGYNASGKSNLVRAFEFLTKFWISHVDSKNASTGVIQFMLDEESRNNPSAFRLVFFRNAIKHRYSLEVSSSVVVREKLEYYPGVQPALIFDRRLEKGVSKIVYGNRIKLSSIVEKEIEIKCLPNISVFSAYNQVNTVVEEIEAVVQWIRTGMLQSIQPLTLLQKYTEERVNTDADFKRFILSCLNEADFNISDIKTDRVEAEIPDDFITKAKLSLYLDSDIEGKGKKIELVDTKFEHRVGGTTKKYYLPIEWQSDGTKRVFGLSGAIYTALINNSFLPIDEIESKLHPRLVEYILEKFLKESEGAQLLLTTHYDNLFDEDDLLRKDNFWFTEKGSDGATKLFPLSGFKGLGRISSLQKAYKFGKFGAVPDIDSQ